jgi:DNA-directed RNA polymerase subunit RPC12/RpoP
MAEFTFTCPSCKQDLEADDSFRGQTVACPQCGSSITVPSCQKKIVMKKRSISDTSSASSTRTASQRTASPPKKSGGKKIPIIIAVIIAVSVIAHIGGSFGKSGGTSSSDTRRSVLPISGRMSKEQWWNKLEDNKLKFPGNRAVMNVQKEDFIRIMGKPNRTQSVGEQTFWYYDCSDGQIQMVISGWVLERDGKIFADTINEY